MGWEGVRVGAVGQAFGVGKCHEFDQFGGRWLGWGAGLFGLLIVRAMGYSVPRVESAPASFLETYPQLYPQGATGL